MGIVNSKLSKVFLVLFSNVLVEVFEVELLGGILVCLWELWIWVVMNDNGNIFVTWFCDLWADKKVFSNFYVLGWYSTGIDAQETDMFIHKAVSFLVWIIECKKGFICWGEILFVW